MVRNQPLASRTSRRCLALYLLPNLPSCGASGFVQIVQHGIDAIPEDCPGLHILDFGNEKSGSACWQISTSRRPDFQQLRLGF